MRLELRDSQRMPLGRATLDLEERPTRTGTSTGREVFLNWDRAVDDSGQLRRCIVCGAGDLFHEKAFPQITPLVVVLAFAGAIVGIFGLVTNIPVLLGMVLVLLLDLGILLFSRRRLVCYGCRTSYHDLPIARYHRRWDRQKAERYPAPTPGSTPASTQARGPDRAGPAAADQQPGNLPVGSLRRQG